MDRTVKDLDIHRYMGTWYEIAHYPFKYQSDCEQGKAIYKWDDNEQKIKIKNECWAGGKMIRSRTANAWIPDKSDKGRLRILFEGTPRDPEGSYLVHWTNYNDAVVGGSDGKSLWWISRKPTVRAKDVEPMLKRIRSFGYNTDNLISSKGIVTK